MTSCPDKAQDSLEPHRPDAQAQIPHAPWLVYLLECADGTLYCGVTTNMARRLGQHNGELRGGAKYTRARRPVRLAACCSCRDRAQAQRLEAALRRLPKGAKIAALNNAQQSNAQQSLDDALNCAG